MHEISSILYDFRRAISIWCLLDRDCFRLYTTDGIKNFNLIKGEGNMRMICVPFTHLYTNLKVDLTHLGVDSHLHKLQ